MLYSAAIPGAQTIAFVNPVRQDCNECTGLFAVGSGHDVIFVKWDGKSPEAQVVGQKLFSVELDIPLSHINIAKSDRHGRVYVGSFSLDFCDTPANKTFYRYTNERGVERIFTDVRTISGLALDEDAGKIYHLDGCNLVISEFDYDPKTGDICK